MCACQNLLNDQIVIYLFEITVVITHAEVTVSNNQLECESQAVKLKEFLVASEPVNLL